MCAGFDVASLMTISRSIQSAIDYTDPDAADGGTPPPPPPMGRAMMNSPPPVPAQRKTPVMNSPPAQAAARKRPPPPPRPSVLEDVAMTDAQESAGSADTNMESVANTLSKMDMDQSPPAAAAVSVDIDAVLPKLTDKNWKVRKEGFEEVKAICEQPGVSASQVDPFVAHFAKMCEDANASALDAGIAAVLAYTVNITPLRKDVVPDIMKRITDKGFSSRPGTVKLCEELVPALVEAGAGEDTITALLEGTSNRKPKVPPACLTATLEALKAFGPRVIPVSLVKPALPKLLESTVNGVRPLAMSIVVEIHRWIGPALVQDMVSNLRPAQQTEYEQLVKDIVVGQAAPTKFVRGAKKPAAAGGAARSGKSGGAAALVGPAAVDPREFAETVDLLAKLPKTEFQAKLNAPKWSEKVEGLKIVLDTIGSIPKLANGDYYELVSTLKLLLNDSNVNIVAKAIEVLGALADGLRKNFTQHARAIFPEILRKLSDKKSVILNAANNSLDLFLQHAMTIDMMMDDLKIALDPVKNKAPPARVQTLGFLARAVEKQIVNIREKALVLEFGTMFLGPIDDTDPTVRKAGVEAFTTLAKSSEQAPGWLQNQLDEIARKNPRSLKQIKQSLGGSSSATATPTIGSRPSSAGSKHSASDAMDVDMTGPPASSAAAPAGKPPAKRPAKGPSPRFGMKPPANAAAKTATPTRKASAAAGGGASSSASSGGSTDFTPIAISVAPEDAEDIIQELNIEDWASIVEGFSSVKWLERKTAIEGLETFATSNSSKMSMRTIEALTVYLAQQVKDFRDSNINVLKSAFQAIGTFAEHAAGKFPRGVVCLVIPNAAEKMGDRKVSETIRTMIVQLCEATSPAYTLGCLMSHVPNVRTPLAHVEAHNVLCECAKDFGVTVCNPRGLVDFAKGTVGLESANPKVRSGATALLAVMYSQLGPALLPILNLDSWKPALASTIEAEFKKIGYDAKTAMASVVRHVKDAEEAPSASSAGDLFGRTDVSGQITKELLADMKCEEDKAAWKKRAAAMDTVQGICEGTGCRIEFTKPVQEVLRGLKARLNDSNANLKVKAAQVIGIVATSVGPDIAKVSKFLGASLIGGVADNKKSMQIASIEALHRWVRHDDKTVSACMDSLLSPLSEGLLNTVGRAELLGWAAEHLQNCERLDLNCLVVPTVQCLMDKSSDAREKAQLLLVEVMKTVGQDTIMTTGCRDIKPAQMRSLKPMIAKVSEIVAASAPSQKAPPAKPVVNAVAPPQVPTMPAAEEESAPARQSSIARSGKLSPRPSKTNGTGTPSRIGSGIRSQLTRPLSARQLVPEAAGGADNAALLKMVPGKSSRLAKAQYNKWVFDSTSVSEMNMRKSEIESEWRPFLPPELHAKLFAPSLEKGMMAALDDLMMCISTQPQEVISALDLLLKWCTLRIVDNNVQALAKLIEVLVKLFEMLKASQYVLDDVEAGILLPYLLQESGQSKVRFRVRFRDIMKLVTEVYSIEKYVVYLAECFTVSKNMKSRCQCIEMIEYIVETFGIQPVGKRYIKEVGKYVVAHEKELRESALGAIVMMYRRSDGDLDKFYRFVGVTSQQGMDLVSARIKHMPANSFISNNTPSTVQVQQQSSVVVGEAPAPAFQSLSSTAPSRLPSGFERPIQVPSADYSVPAPAVDASRRIGGYDADVVMEPSQQESAHRDGRSDYDENQILQMVVDPIVLLLTDSKEIIDQGSPEYEDGIMALKGLYAIVTRPLNTAEVEFTRHYVNELIVKLCDCVHCGFAGGNKKKPLSMMVVCLSLSTLNAILVSEAVDSIQRYAVERVLLEMCSKLLDERMEDFWSIPNAAAVDVDAMSPDKKRLFFVYKALNIVVRLMTKNLKAGEVYPSVINLLQRILRNDVGDYNSRDALNHLLKKDSLDQMVGRMLVSISKSQANTVNPFEGIDIFGVLMQMHSFFATMPQSDMFAINIAQSNMEEALKIIATSLMEARRGTFEKALNDLPITSPVRERLEAMGFSTDPQAHQLPSEATGSHYAPAATGSFASRYGNSELNSNAAVNHNANGSVEVGSNAAQTDSITRRLFDAAATSDAAPGRLNSARGIVDSLLHTTGTSGTASTRTSFGNSAFGDRSAGALSSRASTNSNGAATTWSDSHTQNLKERLGRARVFHK